MKNPKLIETPGTDEFGRRDFIKLLGGGIIIFFTVDCTSFRQQGLARNRARAPQGFGDRREWVLLRPISMPILKIGEDGKVPVFSGKIEQGQGNTTALAQMAAEELGVSLDSINMIMGDTDLCPMGYGNLRLDVDPCLWRRAQIRSRRGKSNSVGDGCGTVENAQSTAER